MYVYNECEWECIRGVAFHRTYTHSQIHTCTDIPPNKVCHCFSYILNDCACINIGSLQIALGQHILLSAAVRVID